MAAFVLLSLLKGSRKGANLPPIITVRGTLLDISKVKSLKLGRDVLEGHQIRQSTYLDSENFGQALKKVHLPEYTFLYPAWLTPDRTSLQF